MALHILYEDNHCLAVAKPAGLLTQGVPPGVPTLEAEVKAYLKEKYHKLGNVYLGIPHRLDRPVSGVVLFARQTASARRLAEQFEKREVTKIYWGAVQGRVEPEEGTWEDWLRKIKEESRSEQVAEGTEGARLCVLSYRRLHDFPGGSLVEFQPKTGACTRFVCKPACAAGRSAVTSSTAPRCLLVLLSSCPAIVSLPCTRADVSTSHSL